MIMICFVAGQWAVYAHQHKTFPAIAKAAHHGTVLTEKCQLCDAMHHTGMVLNKTQYFTPAVCADHFYKQGKYDFISFSLVLASGRAPPVS